VIHIRGLAVLAGAWLRTSVTEISVDVREVVAHKRCVRDEALNKSTVYFTIITSNFS